MKNKWKIETEKKISKKKENYLPNQFVLTWISNKMKIKYRKWMKIVYKKELKEGGWNP